MNAGRSTCVPIRVFEILGGTLKKFLNWLRVLLFTNMSLKCEHESDGVRVGWLYLQATSFYMQMDCEGVCSCLHVNYIQRFEPMSPHWAVKT